MAGGRDQLGPLERLTRLPLALESAGAVGLPADRLVSIGQYGSTSNPASSAELRLAPAEAGLVESREPHRPGYDALTEAAHAAEHRRLICFTYKHRAPSCALGAYSWHVVGQKTARQPQSGSSPPHANVKQVPPGTADVTDRTKAIDPPLDVLVPTGRARSPAGRDAGAALSRIDAGDVRHPTACVGDASPRQRPGLRAALTT